jgi:prephenate dehydratase
LHFPDLNLWQAALRSFPTSLYEHYPCITIGGIHTHTHLSPASKLTALDIFECVQDGSASLGVVPFENSTNGSVVFTLDLLADRDDRYPDLSICDEIYLDVHHYLLGHKVSPFALIESPQDSRESTPTPSVPNPLKPRSKPLGSLKHIKKIYTHPQAFGQCEIFLCAYLKGVERIDTSSTSKAAEMVKQDISGTSVAIASQVASEIHHLDVLAKAIEDRADNTTRFFVIRRGQHASPTPNPATTLQEIGPVPACKSLLSFTVDHRSPGALADVLDCFRRHKLNLTSINSRPSRITSFQYIFFVEFEGSKFYDPEGAVQGALDCVSKVAQSWRLWGSFENKLRI